MRDLYLEGTPQGGTCCRVLCTDEGWDSPQNYWRAAVLAQLRDRDTADTNSACQRTAQKLRSDGAAKGVPIFQPAEAPRADKLH